MLLFGTAYVVGELCALAALAVLTFGLARRALRSYRAAATELASYAVTPSVLAAPGSVAPPGAAPVAPPRPPARPRARATRRPWVTDTLAALVCAALLIGGVVRIAQHHAGNGPFDTPQGRELHAGFVGGCSQSAGGVVDCDCVWDHITAVAPFDTPAGFAALGGVPISSAGVQQLPRAVVDALLACR